MGGCQGWTQCLAAVEYGYLSQNLVLGARDESVGVWRGRLGLETCWLEHYEVVRRWLWKEEEEIQDEEMTRGLFDGTFAAPPLAMLETGLLVLLVYRCGCVVLGLLLGTVWDFGFLLSVQASILFCCKLH